MCFFNDTATTEIYTLSLHDALPISDPERGSRRAADPARRPGHGRARRCGARRSEEHTSELQSQSNLVCRLLLEKKTKGMVGVQGGVLGWWGKGAGCTGAGEVADRAS